MSDDEIGGAFFCPGTSGFFCGAPGDLRKVKSSSAKSAAAPQFPAKLKASPRIPGDGEMIFLLVVTVVVVAIAVS